MKAVIATNNEVKIEGARKALEHYFENVDVIGIDIKSEVAEQPVNDEIYKGAKNRIINLKQYCIDKSISADLFLSIESGISNQLGEWQIISIALIEDNDKLSSFSTTAGFPISEKYIDNIVKKGVPYVMKNIFGNQTNQKGIQLLTNNVLSRADLIEEAFVLGLVKIIHKGNREVCYMDLTIRKMQTYLKEKYSRTKPEELHNTQRYFLKLIEEVGELAEVIRKDKRMQDNEIKGTVEEEISDVLYYTLMIANTYDIDLEKCFREKEELNCNRYGHTLKIDDIEESKE